MVLDRIQGCLVGGAVGDALGYPVEFNTNIIKDGKYLRYFDDYIIYDKDYNKAEISDDTQMTLFTAEALINRRDFK